MSYKRDVLDSSLDLLRLSSLLNQPPNTSQDAGEDLRLPSQSESPDLAGGNTATTGSFRLLDLLRSLGLSNGATGLSDFISQLFGGG